MISIGFAIFFVATVWIPLMLGYLMIEGLNEGVVRAQSYGAYSRLKEPVWFWIVIAMYGEAVLGFGYLYIRVGSSIFSGS